ncbi:DUF417 family protein [Carboxylicivirga sp. A043]|uniref:DUF417 family protein n=1 Tax=Carboxylicivirga litoralis TaxID=2816963 RepID=UPI0021CB771B|nr:DUF417 family protein [Carboxylicivirga sp. A043]MCU4155952.1 DUF417 family protein [Carboxylicivirga sp. A043]
MIAKTFKTAGQFILRYGLAITFIWLGLMKLRNSEADYLKQVLSNSSMFSWMLKYITSYAFSQMLAYLQMIIGVLIALKPVARKVSFWGGVAATVILLISVSTLFTSSYVWQAPYGFPELSKLGQSILKDVILLGGAMWCVGDSA